MAGASLRDIRRRIRSVKNTEQITRAMKMVAAAKLRRAQEVVIAARPWAERMDRIARGLALRNPPDHHPLLALKETGPALLVVVGADRGLCGAFNANVHRAVIAHLAEVDGAGPEVGRLLIIGKKPYEFFRHRHFPIVNHYSGLIGKHSYTDAQRVGDEIIEAYIDGDVRSVQLVYHEFRSALHQRLVIRELLPVRYAEEPQEEGPPGEVVDYLYEPDAATLLDAALRRHIHTQVWRALLESEASEHGARMVAMDAATENAVEMIATLTLVYNRVRQAGITKEIIEVVSGADALKG
ncbi:MAG: ATP synthase F1 subunit gamma [Candidatus Tectimicrobiota bacterium]